MGQRAAKGKCCAAAHHSFSSLLPRAGGIRHGATSSRGASSRFDVRFQSRSDDGFADLPDNAENTRPFPFRCARQSRRIAALRSHQQGILGTVLLNEDVGGAVEVEGRGRGRGKRSVGGENGLKRLRYSGNVVWL